MLHRWSAQHAELLGLEAGEEGSGQLQRVLEEYRQRLERGFLEAQELQGQRESVKAQYAAMEAEYTTMFERANVQLEAFVQCDQDLHHTRHLAMVSRGHVIESLAVGWARRKLVWALERWGMQLGLGRCRRQLESVQLAAAQDMARVQEALQLQHRDYLADCNRDVAQLKSAAEQDKRVLLNEIHELQTALDALPAAGHGLPESPQKQRLLDASREAVRRLTEERNAAMDRCQELEALLDRAQERLATSERKAGGHVSPAEQALEAESMSLRATVRTLRKKSGEQEVLLERSAREIAELRLKVEGHGELQTKVAG